MYFSRFCARARERSEKQAEEKPIVPITKKRRIRAFPHFASPLKACSRV
jgi:hypothetical protein